MSDAARTLAVGACAAGVTFIVVAVEWVNLTAISAATARVAPLRARGERGFYRHRANT
jgi:hypothetical protein